MWMPRRLVLILSAACLASCGTAAAQATRTVNVLDIPSNGSEAAWWSVTQEDAARLKVEASRLKAALDRNTREFTRELETSIAHGHSGNAAQGLGYLINPNMTISGGCPVPPPSQDFLQEVGAGLAGAVSMAAQGEVARHGAHVLLSNVTARQVSNVAVAGLYLAAVSCGPPDDLSSPNLEAVVAKYASATCYYAGPILDAPLLVPGFAETLHNATRAAEDADPWAVGAVLSAFQRCLAEGPSARAPPPWLDAGLGPVPDAGAPAAGPAPPAGAGAAGLATLGGSGQGGALMAGGR